MKIVEHRKFIPQMLNKDDIIGIELGVAAGINAFNLLENNTNLTLHCIDSWNSGAHLQEEYEHTLNYLSEFENRAVIYRETFKEALNRYPDEFFDFIYIDGYAHTGQDSGVTINDWWPKLKTGGIYSGHDYNRSFPLTVEEVDKFSKKVNLPVHIVPGHHTSYEEQFESWVIFK